MVGLGFGWMIGALLVGLCGVALGPPRLIVIGGILFLLGVACATLGKIYDK